MVAPGAPLLLASPPSGLVLMSPASLAWLAVAVLAALALAGFMRWRRKALARLADATLLPRLAPRVAASRVAARGACIVVALALLAVAVADPRGAERVEAVEQRGIDVMVVLDVSRSMLAEDAAPNRLTRAKQFAADLVDAIGTDRVGLIEFAGVPALRCPLTFNHRAFLTQLDLLSPQTTVRGGSMLGDAIRLAAANLKDSDTGRAIIVLSDGEDMESEPVEAAATAARDLDVRTIAIGIGDRNEGARIPIGDTRSGKRYLTFEGQEVWTKMDPTLLSDVAAKGNGFFVDAGTSQVDMRDVAQYLAATIDSSTRERADVRTREPLHQWFSGAALLALLLAPLVGIGGLPAMTARASRREGVQP